MYIRTYMFINILGVDFIKNDCSFGKPYSPDQIDLVSNAMDYVKKTMNGYEFAYSLSPGYQTKGPPNFPNVEHITEETNMFRINQDIPPINIQRKLRIELIHFADDQMFPSFQRNISSFTTFDPSNHNI